MGRHLLDKGRLIVRASLLQTVCGKSINLRQEPGLYLYLKRGFY